MKIVIANDHAGYNLKVFLKEYLLKKGYEVIDLGTDSEESVDYPIFGFKLGKEVIKNKCYGIGICGSGIGISIAANKIKGIRAFNCNSADLARLSREHNDANVICFGERLVKKEEALNNLEIFLNTQFSGQRHKERVLMLDEGE